MEWAPQRGGVGVPGRRLIAEGAPIGGGGGSVRLGDLFFIIKSRVATGEMEYGDTERHFSN
jgi:hypothetical protein